MRNRWVVGVLCVAVLSLAGCGSSGNEQASIPPTALSPSREAAISPSSSDRLEGEWRTEFGCLDSVRAIEGRLSAKQIHEQVGSWKAFLEVWGGEPTKDDPCHGASGTTALLARFADGNLALCDAETGGCEVSATYKLLDGHTIVVNDEEGNLCPCPATWRFEIAGDELTFRVQADAFVVGAWEAASWIRES